MCKRLIMCAGLFAFAGIALEGAPVAVQLEEGITATFSIVAVDPATGICGAAVASKYPAVGKVVPYVRGGVGAFCTQHWHHPQWGEQALDLLAQDKPPEEVLTELLRDDPRREQRQLAIIDLKGRAANRNPSAADKSSEYWGAMTGKFYACQGNTLAGPEVITAMARAYENSAGSIADRLMAALVAGDRAGGDHRGRLAAGIRVARPDPSGKGPAGNWLELDVDESNDAVAELARKYAALDHEAKGAPSAAVLAARDDRVRLIFDTDMGNDIDDALALGVIHALQSRGECELLAVTVSKDNEFAAPFVDLVNSFYGRSGIPIGVVRAGKTTEDSKYIRLPSEARTADGQQRYPHRLLSGKDAPEAVSLLRRTLAAQPDGSVVIAVVGFSTNLARLLESPADADSPLAGSELVARKCRLLVLMAGMFGGDNRQKEYNVYIDLDAAKKVFADWPTPLVASGFEIGQAIKYPASSIERDFRYVPHHPLREAYALYQKMPYDRETWDLTAVLYAIRPDHGYFGLSQPGTIRVDEREITQFAPSDTGRQRFLTVMPEQIIRVKEALVQLTSQPPGATTTP